MGAGASTTHTTRMDMTAAEAHELVDKVFTDEAVANGLVRTVGEYLGTATTYQVAMPTSRARSF